MGNLAQVTGKYGPMGRGGLGLDLESIIVRYFMKVDFIFIFNLLFEFHNIKTKFHGRIDFLFIR
jgi:hypothetical protein